VTRIRLKYIQAWVDREGRPFHYFRRPGFPRVRLPGLPGSPEFMSAYQAALAVPARPIGATRTKPGSLNAALVLYYKSPEFIGLSTATQAMRRAILERWRVKDGDKPIALLPPEYITHLLSPLKPHAARSWLKSIRHFAQYCVANKLMRSDPTLGIRRKVPNSDGHHTWSEEEIAQFETFYPIGSKARLALGLGLFTAQRRGDVIRMGRQHLRDCQDERLRERGVRSVLSVRQQKTGTPVVIPVQTALQAMLEAAPSNHLTFLTTKKGKGYSANDFSEQFRAWCDAAALPDICVFHGLRKAALTRFADDGWSPHEIAAFSGHLSLKEIEHYTKHADRARLAREALLRMMTKENAQRTETVKPEPPKLSKPLKKLQIKSEG
jgi:integrase